MHPYFSHAWCQHAVAAFNHDPDAADALAGWQGDVGLFVDELGVWLAAPSSDRLGEAVLMTTDALEAKNPVSQAKASRVIWAQLIDGTLDPIAAIVQKRLVLKGDVQQIASRLSYRGLAQRWLAAIRGST